MAYRWMSGAAVVAFVASAGLIYWTSSARQPRSAKPSSTDEVRALRAELAEMKQNTATSLLLARAANERALQPAAAPSPVAAEVDRPASAATPESAPTDAEDARRLEIEQAESLDRKFDAEPMDRAWAAPAAQEARRALQLEISGDTSLQRVECRTTWCRIETSHADVDAFKSFANKSLLNREKQLWNGGISATIRDESEAGVVAVTFITREGHAMPLPDGVEATPIDLHAAAR
jgi:hypothetical protein